MAHEIAHVAARHAMREMTRGNEVSEQTAAAFADPRSRWIAGRAHLHAESVSPCHFPHGMAGGHVGNLVCHHAGSSALHRCQNQPELT